MKYISIFGLIINLIIITTAFSESDRMNIAVIDLDPTGISLRDAQFLSDRLRAELFETGVFQVIEREKMDAILHEQGFQNAGCTSVECAVEIGQLLNVNKMIAGSIGRIEEIYSINLRVINVETGAIVKTATKDYEGKLSAVLTKVIPEVANILAADIVEPTKTKANILSIKKENPTGKISRFGLFLKGGLAFLQYTTNINQSIDMFNSTNSNLAFDKLSQHSNLGVEGRYALSRRWHLKFGFSIERMLSTQKYDINDYNSDDGTIYLNNEVFERENSFTNGYLGLNFILWFKPQKYFIYSGIDIGSTDLESVINQKNTVNTDGNELDNKFKYNAFTFKFLAGFAYHMSQSLSLASELVMKSVSKYNTADQDLLSIYPTEFSSIIFPKEFEAGGLQLNLVLGYHF
jgi:hypothetical protein